MAETLSAKTVTARKPCTCDWCSKPIGIGEQYERSTVKSCGEIYTWHACGRCKGYVSEMWEGGYYYDEYGTSEFEEFMWDNHREVAEEWW